MKFEDFPYKKESIRIFLFIDFPKSNDEWKRNEKKFAAQLW